MPGPKNSIHTESKLCAHCGRPFTNRKRYASRGQWDMVKYCSRACRTKKKPKQVSL